MEKGKLGLMFFIKLIGALRLFKIMCADIFFSQIVKQFEKKNFM